MTPKPRPELAYEKLHYKPLQWPILHKRQTKTELHYNDFDIPNSVIHKFGPLDHTHNDRHTQCAQEQDARSEPCSHGSQHPHRICQAQTGRAKAPVVHVIFALYAISELTNTFPPICATSRPLLRARCRLPCKCYCLRLRGCELGRAPQGSHFPRAIAIHGSQ
jgi:hypothetical protein